MNHGIAPGWSRIAATYVPVTLGIVFVLSSLVKMFSDNQVIVDHLVAVGLSTGAAIGTSSLLPLAELLIGLILCLRFKLPVFLAVSLSLLAGFSLFVVLLLFRYQTTEVDCGCGLPGSPNLAWTLVRNGLLLVANATALVVVRRNQRAADSG